jgi:hypothetical protein
VSPGRGKPLLLAGFGEHYHSALSTLHFHVRLANFVICRGTQPILNIPLRLDKRVGQTSNRKTPNYYIISSACQFALKNHQLSLVQLQLLHLDTLILGYNGVHESKSNCDGLCPCSQPYQSFRPDTVRRKCHQPRRHLAQPNARRDCR